MEVIKPLSKPCGTGTDLSKPPLPIALPHKSQYKIKLGQMVLLILGACPFKGLLRLG